MVAWSAVAHAGALGLVLAAPSGSHEAPPRVISVELVAPSPAPSSPAPAPAAKPAPPKPPPPPKPKQVVLPEHATAPKPKAKPEPKPPEREMFEEPEEKREKSLDELMAELRDEVDQAAPGPTPDEPVQTARAPSPGTAGGRGDPLSPEERDWHARVIRKMKGVWAVPPGFRTQPLETHVTVKLDAAGNILGTPRRTRSSGNPWFDEGVMRALTKADPLPANPNGAGEYPMVFRPSDSL
jgi:TonB family protein